MFYLMVTNDATYKTRKTMWKSGWKKMPIAHVLQKVARPMCVQVLTGRGYQSTTVKHEYAERAKRALSLDKSPIVLYCGDYDPSGMNILESVIQDIHDDFGLPEVQFIRVALNLDQIEEYNLPSVPIKAKDRRKETHRRRYGDIAVELDALHPGILRELATQAMESLFDMGDY